MAQKAADGKSLEIWDQGWQFLLWGGVVVPRSHAGTCQPLGRVCGCHSAAAQKIPPLGVGILGSLLAASGDRWHSSYPLKSWQLKAARRLGSLSHVPVCPCILHLVLQSRKEPVIRYVCAFVPLWPSPKAALSCLFDSIGPARVCERL